MSEQLRKSTGITTGRPYTPAHDPYKRLAWAMLWQAAEDVRCGNDVLRADAAAWLMGEGHELVDALGMNIDQRRWRAWVLKGCRVRRGQRMPVRSVGRPSAKMPAFFPGYISESKSLGDPGWSMIQPAYLCGGA